MGTIATGNQWRFLRENQYKLPKGVGPSLGSALDKYHQEKKKGVSKALDSLEDVQKMVEKFQDSKKVKEYYEKKGQTDDYKNLQTYLGRLLTDIETRLKKLSSYIRILKDSSLITAEEALASGKFRPLLFAQAEAEHSQETYQFLLVYKKLNFRPNTSEADKALRLLDLYFKPGSSRELNIGSGVALPLQRMLKQADELKAAEQQGDLTLWQDLYEKLAAAHVEAQKVLTDTLRRVVKTDKFKIECTKLRIGKQAYEEMIKNL